MHKASTFTRKSASGIRNNAVRSTAAVLPAKALKLFQLQTFVVVLLLSSLLFSLSAQAHTPLFDCFDNGDATMTCEGGFSDGSSAAGVAIRVVDAQGKVLEQGELDADGAIVLARPAGEFSVVFASGEEHSLTVLGDDII
ncbi:MAG: hypothetical protein RLZZ227_2575 [Pseudomonadota bacterium]